MPGILIVESQLAPSLHVGNHLRALGVPHHIVGDAIAASKAVFQVRPDLILLDIDSTCYNGLDFHECLQSSQRSECIRVAYWSRKCNWIQKEWAGRLQAVAILSKKASAESTAHALIRLMNESSSQPAMVSA